MNFFFSGGTSAGRIWYGVYQKRDGGREEGEEGRRMVWYELREGKGGRVGGRGREGEGERDSDREGGTKDE